MKMILKVLWEKFCNLFKKPTFKSTQQDHWINHIYDETVTWPNKALMWANVHGFDEGPGQTYWVGLDIRSFGIRVADYIVKCKNKSTYNEYISAAVHNTENFLYKMRQDGRMNYRYGNDVNVEFNFKWGGETKSFDVHLSTDSYAEEK